MHTFSGLAEKATGIDTAWAHTHGDFSGMAEICWIDKAGTEHRVLVPGRVVANLGKALFLREAASAIERALDDL